MYALPLLTVVTILLMIPFSDSSPLNLGTLTGASYVFAAN